MMRRARIADKDIVACYEQHERIMSVADEFGISKSYVWKILKRNGVQCTHRHEKTSKRDSFPSHCKTKYCHATVCALAEFGYSHSQITECTRTPIASVSEIIRRKRPELYQPLFGVRHVDLYTIEAEYLDGATTYELGDKYGVHPRTIGKWMRKLGHVRGKGNAGGNYRQRQTERFLDEFPDKLEASKDGRRRAEVRRQYRIASRPHDGPTTGLTWQDIARRNGGNLKCWICGDVCDPEASGDKHPSVDHIIPLSNGGTDTYDNVRIACLGCNRDRNNRVQMTLDYLMYESR